MTSSQISYHPLLARQIESLRLDHLEDPAILNFLQSINKTYCRLEKEKKFSEHAFELTEKEYQAVTKDLMLQVDLRVQSIQKLKDAICLFDDGPSFNANDKEDDILEVIKFLKKQIKQSRILQQQLRKAKDAAENASNAKGDFLSVMSHEIRTPLNAINGIIHLLLLDNPAPHQMENLKALDISADNLLSLINDILDFNKIEDGKISFNNRNFELRSFLNTIKLTYNQCAADKGNTIDIIVDEHLPSTIKGDDLRLKQVLNNLVSNAIKFTQKGRIVLEAKLRTGGAKVEIEFSVSDNGIGIEKDKQAHIFERFAQADASTTREYGGTGLGLAITKKLLQLQKSEIFVESDPGKGSRFYFTLVFEKEEVQIHYPQHKKAVQDNLGGIKVLLVDDNSMNVLFTQKLMHKWNTEVDVAGNGEEAVSKANLKLYDVILMDLHMPVMDGFTASTKIRQFNKSTPIIALTASTDFKEKQMEQSGLNDYLQKPFKPNELYDMISKHAQS